MSLAWNSENAEKTECMFWSHEQKSRQNYSIKRVNKSFENVTKLKYSGIILMDQQRFTQNARVIEGSNFVT
jgi:hypothetical protein